MCKRFHGLVCVVIICVVVLSCLSLWKDGDMEIDLEELKNALDRFRANKSKQAGSFKKVYKPGTLKGKTLHSGCVLSGDKHVKVEYATLYFFTLSGVFSSIGTQPGVT